MLKKMLLLLLVVGSGPACQLICTDSCCGSNTKPGYYDIEGVSLTAISSTGSSGLVLTTGTSVPRNLLVLRLAPTTRYFTRLTPSGGAGLAWACSPLEPTFTEQIDSVTVRSRFDYDARHPAGTPLNDLLLVDTYGTIPLNDYLRQYDGRPEPLLSLRLGSSPVANGPQQLLVRYRLRNGEVHEAQTPEFVLER